MSEDLTYPTFPTDEDIRRVANEMIRDISDKGDSYGR